MKSKKLIVVIVIAVVVCLLGYIAVRNTDHQGHDDHAGHDHDQAKHLEESYDHEDHEEHEGLEDIIFASRQIPFIGPSDDRMFSIINVKYTDRKVIQLHFTDGDTARNINVGLYSFNFYVFKV